MKKQLLTLAIIGLKIKKYILRPYRLTQTICRFYYAWLFIRFIYKQRHELYLKYRFFIVELQDEIRVMKPLINIQIELYTFINQIKKS